MFVLCIFVTIKVRPRRRSKECVEMDYSYTGDASQPLNEIGETHIVGRFCFIHVMWSIHMRHGWNLRFLSEA